MASMAVVPITTYCPQYSPQLRSQKSFLFLSRPANKGKNASFATARLFGPSIFEASKLRVLFLGVDEEKHPGHLPRAYTITHSDITAKLTLAVSQTINMAQLQGWYNRLQRDEVVAEWKKMQGKMSLHVHCHISGGHLLLDFIANLRYYIFSKELPLVLKAVVHGDGNLFSKHPELEEALVWVYFHSNLQEFNRVECWGPLKDATEALKVLIFVLGCRAEATRRLKGVSLRIGQDWTSQGDQKDAAKPAHAAFLPHASSHGLKTSLNLGRSMSFSSKLKRGNKFTPTKLFDSAA